MSILKKTQTKHGQNFLRPKDMPEEPNLEVIPFCSLNVWTMTSMFQQEQRTEQDQEIFFLFPEDMKQQEIINCF